MPVLQKTLNGETEFVLLGPGRTLIGRSSESHVRVPLAVVSKTHAVIHSDVSGWSVENRSPNGTYLNGERLIGGLYPLKHGDEFRIGSCRFVFLNEQPVRDSLSSDESDFPSVHVMISAAGGDESIRRQVVTSDAAIQLIEQVGDCRLLQDRILKAIQLSEQAHSTLATEDSVRVVSQLLRLSSSIYRYFAGEGTEHLLVDLHAMFPQASQIVIVEASAGQPTGGRIFGASSHTESPIVVCMDVLRRVTERRECLLLGDLWRDSPGEKPMLSRMGRVSLLCVPMVTDVHGCQGVIQMLATAPNGEFGASDLERLAILAQFLSIVFSGRTRTD